MKNQNLFKCLNERLFNYLYIKIRNLLIIPNYKFFQEKYNFLKKSQWWTHEQIEEYQWQELQKLLNHAYENVPYYRNLFDESRINIREIKTIKDFQKIPSLTKELVRKNIDTLQAKNFPKYKFKYATSGGTTGTPLGFYVEKNISYVIELVFFKILLDRIGCNFKDKFVFLRGTVNSLIQKKIWKYSLLDHSLILSQSHMNERNLPLYIKKIRNFKPKYIVSYSSSLCVLARYMKKHNIGPFNSVKAIVVGAENLYDWQRDLLEETFRCRIFDCYGLAEGVVLAAGCENSNYYHFFPEYGFLELIGRDGLPVTKEGEMGEIVGTGFYNNIFPFIRYRTGDLGIFTTKKCSCGRNYPIFKKIEGRVQEFIVTKTKRLIPLTGTGFYHLIAKSSQNVNEIQFYQEVEGKVILKIVKGENYCEEDENRIKNQCQKVFGKDIEITFHYVDYISRTTVGRCRLLIQNLPIEFN